MSISIPIHHDNATRLGRSPRPNRPQAAAHRRTRGTAVSATYILLLTLLVSSYALIASAQSDDDDTCTAAGRTFARGESYGDVYLTPCGTTTEFPCFCNPDLDPPVECPYCSFSTEDGRLCAKDGQNFRFTDTNSIFQQCGCTIRQDGSPRTQCETLNEADTSTPDADTCVIRVSDFAQQTFQRGENLGDVFENRCGSAADFPCFCRPPTQGGNTDNMPVTDMIYCPYCGYSVPENSFSPSQGGNGRSVVCLKDDEALLFNNGSEDGTQDLLCQCDVDLAAQADPVSTCTIITEPPTRSPTPGPTLLPTPPPTPGPTPAPTPNPTAPPTPQPTTLPPAFPPTTPPPTPPRTQPPTAMPTAAPTKSPTKAPTKSPTKMPTKAPTKSPTKMPTKAPTKSPTLQPTIFKSATKAPVIPPVPVSPPPTVPPAATPIDISPTVPEEGCFVDTSSGDTEFIADGESFGNLLLGPCGDPSEYPWRCSVGANGANGNRVYPFCVFAGDPVEGNNDGFAVCAADGETAQIRNAVGEVISCSCLFLNDNLGAISSCPLLDPLPIPAGVGQGQLPVTLSPTPDFRNIGGVAPISVKNRSSAPKPAVTLLATISASLLAMAMMS